MKLFWRASCWVFLGVVIFGRPAVLRAAAMQSAYSDLQRNRCKVTEKADNGEGDYRALNCPGINGYSLLHLQDDERESLTVVYKDQKFDLDLWGRINSSFNRLGDKAEWRMDNGKPIALIVRMLMDNPKKQALIVSKISPENACMIKVIDASKMQDANDQARQTADHAADLPCLWTQGSS